MKTIEERLATLEAAVAAMQSKATVVAPVDLASDQYADFTVRKSPPKWLTSGGQDYAGTPISQTSPEFCDAIAGFLDWQAGKDEERNHSYVNAKGATVFPAQYARKDAARARAWAVKLRAAPAAKWQPPKSRQATPSSSGDFDYGTNGDDGVPF